MIQGIRGAESPARAKMSAQCTYFKYYFEPYGYDKNGKPRKHSYRGKEVRAFREKFADDLLRPVFDWSAQQVIEIISSPPGWSRTRSTGWDTSVSGAGRA